MKIDYDKIIKYMEEKYKVPEFPDNKDFSNLAKNTDRVNHPSHYTWLKELCGIEPIDICRHLNFNEGNICKYLLRKDKEDIIPLQEKRIEDLEKIIFYAKDEIKRLKGE